MPELKNHQHEKFCRALVTEPSGTQAYKKVYKTTNDVTANANSSRLLRNADVRERARELLNAQGLSVPELNCRLAKWVNDDEHASVSLDAVKTGYRIHGVLDPTKNEVNAENIEVNIVNLTSTKTCDNPNA